MSARILAAAPDLFGNLIAPPLLVRLDRQIDHEKPCCNNVAVVGPGKAQHTAALRCETCGAHRGWLRREALDFLTDLSQRFGAPAEPITLRDSSIGGHTMTEKKFDDTNRGVLFKNEKKENERHADYRGEINVAGKPFWLDAWIKTSSKTGKKFMSLSVKPKEQRTAAAKPKSAFADMDDGAGF
jgi:hypothetical protein